MDKRLEEYARLAVRMGANLQEGDTMLLRAPVDCAEFARMIVKEAYDAGAKEVIMGWRDDTISRLNYLHAADEVFDSFHEWEKVQYDTLSKGKFVLLTIDAEDPEALKGVDPERIRRSVKARMTALKDYSDKLMASEFSWSIVAVPILSWAKKMFPDLSDDAAMDALWEAIYETMRIDGSGDAVEKWKLHTARLQDKCDKLNALDLKQLHYKTELGTDFTVDLPEGAIWCGGADKNKQGIDFIANMPTEEVFTAPQRDSGNGVIAASKPLCLNGTMVEGIRFTVENGKIVKAEADCGLEVLEKTLEVDEGSRYFGELALVDYDSPISNQNLLYYNTLFDENASCHIAFGAAYPDCVKGTEGKSTEELMEMGLNDSLNHVDFMVGTAKTEITGITKDGQTVVIMKDGNFAL
ncbi:MAG: aminopeptidase [Lachnospiraceae bacterium]|nr:aminopeptidase [Lachnospiraceae bacterium]